jgi:hypothetical protein
MCLRSIEAEHAQDIAMWIAEAQAFRGHKDEAFNWLDRAYTQKDTWLWEHQRRPTAQESRSRSPLERVPAQDESAGVTTLNCQ